MATVLKPLPPPTPTKGYQNGGGSNRDDSHVSPTRGRQTPAGGGAHSSSTTVDHFIMSGVVGVGIEGPKTPGRAPNVAVRSPGRPQTGTYRTNNSGHMNDYSHTANGYAHQHETLAHETLHSTGRYIHRNGGPTSPINTRYDEVEAVNGRHHNGTAYGFNDNNYLEISQDEDDLADGHEDHDNMFLNEQEEQVRENNPFKASSSSPLNSRRGSRSLYASFERVARHEADGDNDNDGYDSNGYITDDLDIGSQEYDSQPEGRSQGHYYEDSSDDSDDAYEREAKIKQLKREAKELKREREQLGFIKQLTNFLRKQRDEFGWGASQQQMAQGEEGEDGDDDLESDPDRDLTSARTRRGSPWRRAHRQRHVSTSTVIDNDDDDDDDDDDDNYHHQHHPDRVDRSPTLQRTLTPTALHKKATPPEILQHRPAAPATMQRTNTPPNLQRTRTPPTLQRTTTPPARHQPATPPAYRRSNTPSRPVEHHWEESAPTHRKDAPSPSVRRSAAPQVTQRTETTTITTPSAVNKVWQGGKSWIHAGVASGLLNPGTLAGVAILCLVVLGRSVLGYDGSLSRQNWRNRDSSCNDTIVQQQQPNPTPVLRDVLSSTLDKLVWGSPQPPTADTNGQSSGNQDVARNRAWLSMWIPQVPSMSDWIPSRTKTTASSESKKSSIQIPSEDIHSLEELESRIEWIQKVLVELGHADEQLSQDFQKKFDGMSVWIAGVEHKLSKVSEEMESLRDYVKNGRWIEQTVLETIRDEIPRHLVVSRDPRTGKLSIPGEFWDTARELFMTQEQVETSLKTELTKLGLDPLEDQEQEGSSNTGGGRWNWGSSKKGKTAIVNWEDFLKENENAMSEFVEGRMSKVSRGAFLTLVKTEANEIWQGLERNVMVLLEKQGKLQGKNAPTRSTSSPDNNNDKVLTDVEQELIMGLIDEALEKYSADAIAKPDYALWSAGGRVIPMLTSSSYYPEVKPTIWGQLGLKYFVKLPRRANPMEKAIQPDVHAGECWAMEGQFGQLGIRLARDIVVTEVTIDHADPSVVLDTNSAPKEIEIWGFGQGEGIEPTASSSSDYPANKAEQPVTVNTDNKQGSQWREDVPWEGATLLTTIQYDTGGDKSPRQTFSIPLSKQTIPSIGVVIRVKSNWGHPNYTCLYRIRVHGHELTAEGH